MVLQGRNNAALEHPWSTIVSIMSCPSLWGNPVIKSITIWAKGRVLQPHNMNPNFLPSLSPPPLTHLFEWPVPVSPNSPQHSSRRKAQSCDLDPKTRPRDQTPRPKDLPEDSLIRSDHDSDPDEDDSPMSQDDEQAVLPEVLMTDKPLWWLIPHFCYWVVYLDCGAPLHLAYWFPSLLTDRLLMMTHFLQIRLRVAY